MRVLLRLHTVQTKLQSVHGPIKTHQRPCENSSIRIKVSSKWQNSGFHESVNYFDPVIQNTQIQVHLTFYVYIKVALLFSVFSDHVTDAKSVRSYEVTIQRDNPFF